MLRRMMMAGTHVLPPGDDEYWPNVVALQNLDGSMIDATGRPWTAEGGVSASASGLVLNADGKSLRTISSNDFNWWSNDYTIEAFIRTDSAGYDSFGRPYTIGEGEYSPGTVNWQFGLNAAGRIAFSYWAGSRVLFTGSTSFPLGEFLHCAAVFEAARIRLYVGGGLQVDAARTALPSPAAGHSVRLGLSGTRTGDGTRFVGAIRGFRATKGVARYAGTSFIPPSWPLPAGGP